MSARLPLPYIRPFGSKCFAGGLLHFRGSGFKAGDLLEPVSPTASAAPSSQVQPSPVSSILCSNRPKGKNSTPAKAGTDNRPFLFDARTFQMVSPTPAFLARTRPFVTFANDILRPFGRFARPNRPRRGGRAAECGGLLDPPALLALANFQVFSGLYVALSG